MELRGWDWRSMANKSGGWGRGKEEVKWHCSQEKAFCCTHKGSHPKPRRSQCTDRRGRHDEGWLSQLLFDNYISVIWPTPIESPWRNMKGIAIMVGYLFWYRKMWSFWVWLTLLNPMNPNSVHFSADVRILFFTVKRNSIVAHFLYLLICWLTARPASQLNCCESPAINVVC